MTVRRALALSFAERYATTAIQFVSIVVLSRLLTPAEIGIYTVGVAVVNFAQMIRDFGVGNYLIQAKDLTRERVASALGVTICIAWSIGLVLLLLSDAAAIAYEEPGVRDVVAVLALTFFLMPLGALAGPLLRRAMRFDLILRIQVIGALAHATTGISLAYLGHGFMSMAWASVANAAVLAVLYQVFLPSEHRTWPGLSAWREIAVFGGFSVGAHLFAEIGRSGPDLVVGRMLGFAPLGLMSRAQGYVKIFNNTVLRGIRPVAHSMLAARNREGGDVKAPYLRTLSYVCGVGWPALAVLGILAFPMIRLLFGDQWDGSVPLARAMCVAAAVMVVVFVNNVLVVALGQVARHFRVAAAGNTLKVGFVILGCLHGIEAAAWSLVLANVVHAWLSLRLAASLVGVSPREYAAAASRSVGVTALSAIGPASVYLAIGDAPEDVLLSIATATPLAFAGWVAGVMLFGHPLRDELGRIVQRLRGFSSRRKVREVR